MQVRSRMDVAVFVLLFTSLAVLFGLGGLYLLFEYTTFEEAFSRTFLISCVAGMLIASICASFARKNTKLTDQLADLVARDRLTNLATRDFFFQRLSECPSSYGISLMIDIDHFKKVNDTYGHLAGDCVIAHVGKILMRHTRPADIVCRFGGEEFVVFLSDADKSRANRVAERIRKAVSQTPITDDGDTIRVTVSIGASLTVAASEIESAIKAADEALYRAKSKGRNRVEFAKT